MVNEKFSWVELTNPRAEREFDFLVCKVGEEKLIDSRGLLGARKAFPLNIARVLCVKLPEDLQFLSADEVKEKIKDMRRRLGSAGGGVGVQREGRGPSVAPDLTPPSEVKGEGRKEDDHA